MKSHDQWILITFHRNINNFVINKLEIKRCKISGHHQQFPALMVSEAGSHISPRWTRICNLLPQPPPKKCWNYKCRTPCSLKQKFLKKVIISVFNGLSAFQWIMNITCYKLLIQRKIILLFCKENSKQIMSLGSASLYLVSWKHTDRVLKHKAHLT